MPSTRREFMQRFGVLLASLLAARCAPVSPGPAAQPCLEWDSPSRAAWERLRECWLDMEEVADFDGTSSIDYPTQLEDTHRDALDSLVEAGEIDRAVANPMQMAFEAAAWHVWRSQASMTCYRPAYSPFFVPLDDLLRQRELLLDAADDLDEEIVERVQSAIALDTAFFAALADLQLEHLEIDQEQHARQELEQDFAAGELEVSPEALEAACILVELLLGDRDRSS